MTHDPIREAGEEGLRRAQDTAKACERTRMGAPSPAIAYLREHQQQLDADGIMVGVSRQALDEVLALVESSMAAPSLSAGLIRQRLGDDCSICAAAMATGLSYETVMATARKGRFGYKPGRGTISLVGLLKDLGIEVFSHNKFLYGVGTSKPVWRAVRAMLWGRRAIVSLPSLNGFAGHHDLFWDGARLHDPSNKETYAPDGLKSALPIGVILFREGPPSKASEQARVLGEPGQSFLGSARALPASASQTEEKDLG